MRRWGFRLRLECPYCGMRLQEESGLTLGTTVIGYTLACILLVLPMTLAVACEWIGLWLGLTIGVLGSFALPAAFYPFLLRVVLALYYGFHPDAFDQDEESPPPQY
jgi:hypothetical protein